MKKVLFTLSSFLFSIYIFSQVPQALKYQAIVRDNSGNVIENTQIALKISILKTTDTGENVYTEEHSVTTNSFGLIVLNIGGGTSISGDFNSVAPLARIMEKRIEPPRKSNKRY